MKKRFYLEFYLSKVTNAFAVSQMISIVHWFNHEENMNLGFDLPEFSEDGFGSLLRVFSQETYDLERLRQSPRLSELRSQEFIMGDCSIRTAPDNASEIRLIRNNGAEKRQPPHWMRYGYSYEESLRKIEELPELQQTAYLIVKLYSVSSKQPMMRCLSREAAGSRVDGAFSSYGYSRVSEPVTLPSFSRRDETV